MKEKEPSVADLKKQGVYFNEDTGEYFDEEFDDFSSETDFNFDEEDYEY